MARDDSSSSQDSTLIDEDLVAALGFEPVSTIDTAEADADEATSTDEARDHSNGNGTTASVNGFGIDQIDDDIQIIDDEPTVSDDIVVDEGSVDAPNGEAAVDGAAVDGAAVDGAVADGVALDELSVADEVADGGDAVADTAERSSFFDLDSADDDSSVMVDTAVDEAVVDEAVVNESLVDGVAVESDELGTDDTELDTDDEVVVDAAEPDEIVLDVDQLVDESPATEAVAPVDDAIEIVPDDADRDEVIDLADADSVFADAAPPIDVPDLDLDLVSAEPLVAEPTTTIGTVDADQAAPIGEETVVAAPAAVPNKRRRRLRARKSRRVVRHIDPWSVLTFSVLFHMVVFASLLLASVLVWNAAIASGMVENVEAFIQELGDYETFEINADVMFRAAIVIAGMLTLASSVLVVLLTVVFNLISDLVGGIRVTVIEEEVVRVPIDKKKSKAANE